MEETYESIFPERPVYYARFFDRFAAAIIDGVILYLIGLPLDWYFSDVSLAHVVISGVANMAINLLYFVLQESGAKQATIGKKAMGIQITTVDGNRISFGQAMGRYFAKLLSTIFLFIGYFMMLWDSRRQTLHDKLANTLVVYK